MAQAKASFQNMKSILTNKRLSLGVRKRVLPCYIEAILLYGCEAWSMTKQTSKSIEAMEMWFLRRMLRVSWTEKRTNLEILNTASSTRKLMNNIKRRQAEFLGHVMRKGKLEHLLTTGKIEGKRSRCRQRIKKRRYSSLAGKKHCGDVCGCKRSQKVEGHDRLRLQQTRQLMMMMINTPTMTVPQSTSDPPEVVGISYAADIIKRERQLILVLRDCVTSYTACCFVTDERRDTIRDSLINLLLELLFN